jgi:carboxypeptidase T
MKIQLKRLFFLCLLFALVGGGLAVGSQAAAPRPERLVLDGSSPSRVVEPEGDGPWVVRAYYSDPRMVDEMTGWTEPWEVNRQEGYVVVGVDRDGYRRLLDAGFRLEVDVALTEELTRPRQALPGQVAGIPGYPCYRTLEETYTTAEGIVAAHPSLASWTDVGNSWEKEQSGGSPGYDMMVLRLTNSAVPGPKPTFFAMASIHAREYAPAELLTRFAEYLVEHYGLDADVTWLLDYHEIHLMLNANPDGRKHAETGTWWRKNTNENYCSPTSDYRGADLNRNFSFSWYLCGNESCSSSSPCDEVYRGPGPASEPETQAVQNYLLSRFPDQREDPLTAPAPPTATGVFMDLHSYGRLVLWPWGFTTTAPPNGTALQTLGRKFAYYNGYFPQQAVGLYPTDGATDDFAYGTLGLAAYTFEVGTSFFQDCSSFETVIWPDNLPALIYAAKVSRTPYLTPSGPDALYVTVAPAGVSPGSPAHLAATLDDTRYAGAAGGEPTQNVVAAEYYLDVPPWVTTTVPVALPMAAVDGAFDQDVEAVEATVDTTGLSLGRHMVFVRGRDAAGIWGVISAAFLDVVEPSPPTAEFATNSPVVLGKEAHFSNLTIGSMPLQYRWDFGDGLGVSLETDPSYTYLSTGTFTVTLVATNTLGSDSVRHPVVLLPDRCVPITGVHLALVGDGTLYPGDDVVFRADLLPDGATKPYTYTVDFGDGTFPVEHVSSEDPKTFHHTFAAAETYIVQMPVRNCNVEEPVVGTTQVAVLDLPCTEVTGVDLTRITTATVYPGQGVAFRADLLPDDAALPYTYTLSAGLPVTATADPLVLTTTFDAPGSYRVEIGVWNCAMTTPLTDSVEIVVSAVYRYFLPLVRKDWNRAGNELYGNKP